MHFHESYSVPGIDPVDGWALRIVEQEDGDGFWYSEYIARSAESDRFLHVSRFDFTPTQARFAWLVENGFPQRPKSEMGTLGPWTDEGIDAAMAADRREAA